ncbi:MAG TPA: hypothetical protein VE522_03070 [Actinomycetota bacterium]|jgi:hypothetical protein|nr:hypothetical protein [Actinomycetota bacterium]
MPVEIAVGSPLLSINRSRWAADMREGTVTVQEERWQPWRFDHEEAPR